MNKADAAGTQRPPLLSPTPRDLAMPSYRFQRDEGPARVSGGDAAKKASSKLLQGFNIR